MPFALIVGSGFERLGFEVLARSPTKTPYGEPSSAVLTLDVSGVRVPCIARHGEEHHLAPHEINYRANVWALEQRGVRACVAINTVGAIDTSFRPGELAVPDQLIDYTHGRVSTFGGAGGAVRHVELTEPLVEHHEGLRERRFRLVVEEHLGIDAHVVRIGEAFVAFREAFEFVGFS